MTIKDEGAAINAVMFRSDASKLRFRLHNGMKIVARGRISSFPEKRTGSDLCVRYDAGWRWSSAHAV